jgi:hypothetical protein
MTVLRASNYVAYSLALIAFAVPAQADSTAKDSAANRNADGQERRVTLRQTVEPSFHIEPIVHRFEALRGAKIPFRFEIRSTGKAMNVTVMPVRLRQELTGIILHDLEGAAPEEIELSSQTEFKLAPGESQYIEGIVTVPLAKSNFLSFGVLVRDNGQASAEKPGESDPNVVKAGVRFVTQYVLRIDIETGVKDLSEMDHLVFEQGQVFSEQGMPVVKTMLFNPTDFAFECAVRGTIKSGNTSRPQPFRMTLPSRASLENDERFLIRIMPKSKIVLSAAVEELLFPGEQTLQLEVTNGRRAVVDQSFAVNVRPGDFPALETKLAYLDRELSVQPAQIEVGKIEGSSRSTNLRFTNSSVNPKTVKLQVRDLQGNELNTIQLSSNDFELKPGRTQTIRASVQSSDVDVAQYGVIQLQIGEGPEQTSQELPLAVLLGQPASPNVGLGELESVEQNGYTSFRLKVTNNGTGYAPVHADLQVARESSGRALELADGFGRWLKPGETRELMFKPQEVLPEGDYQVSLRLQTTPDQAPVTQTLIIHLAPTAAEVAPAN